MVIWLKRFIFVCTMVISDNVLIVSINCLCVLYMKKKTGFSIHWVSVARETFYITNIMWNKRKKNCEHSPESYRKSLDILLPKNCVYILSVLLYLWAKWFIFFSFAFRKYRGNWFSKLCLWSIPGVIDFQVLVCLELAVILKQHAFVEIVGVVILTIILRCWKVQIVRVEEDGWGGPLLFSGFAIRFAFFFHFV